MINLIRIVPGRVILLFFLVVVNSPQVWAEKYTIVAFGDSLTSGDNLQEKDRFPRQLQASLQNKGYDVEVINEGVWGEETAQGKERIDDVLSYKLDIIIIELGANDMFRRRVPEITKRNLSEIISKSKKAGAKVLLAGMKAPINYGIKYSNAFNVIYKELAMEEDVALYPFFLQDVARHRELIGPDGLHPNHYGVATIVGNIQPILEEMIDDLNKQ